MTLLILAEKKEAG